MLQALVSIIGAGSGIVRVRVQGFAYIEICGVIAALFVRSLVTRPAEILDNGIGRIADTIDFLPACPPHIANPHLVRAGTNCRAVGVPQAVRNDAIVLGVPADQGVRRQGRTRIGIDAKDRATVADRISGCSEVLAAQCATLGIGQGLKAAPSRRWVATRVRRYRASRPAAALAIIHKSEARTVSRAHIERSVPAEYEVAYGVAWVLLTPPVLDQDLLGTDQCVVRRHLEPGQLPVDYAPIARGAGRIGARVRPARRPRAGIERIIVVGV